VRVAVRDDGRGIDVERVKAKAVERGLADPSTVTTLDDKNALAFVLRAGFSTRDEANEWSGRGVGLDAVARAVEALGGTIEIDTVRGAYTEIACSLPVLRKDYERQGGTA
jgi:two-component system chemotaxis sensor kinase CheA